MVANEEKDTNEKKDDYLITTSDNPFNPWTNFDEWFAYDVVKGYNTCSILARICEDAGQDLGDREELLSYYDAAERMLQYNLTGNYCKALKPKELVE